MDPSLSDKPEPELYSYQLLLRAQTWPGNYFIPPSPTTNTYIYTYIHIDYILSKYENIPTGYRSIPSGYGSIPSWDLIQKILHNFMKNHPIEKIKTVP